MHSAIRFPLQPQILRRIVLLLLGLAMAFMSATLWAHGVNENDKAFIEGASGVNIDRKSVV